MTASLQQRWFLAAVGAVGGLCLYGLVEALDRDLLSDRVTLPLVALVGTLFGGILAMSGPVGPGRALLNAAGLALVTALLVWLTSLRHDSADAFFDSPLPILAALVVATLPMPFLIAMSGPGWRDYPTLFLGAWTIVVRYAAAWAFTGVVWLVIFLSSELLSIVGVTVIDDLVNIPVVPYLITGAVLGLAMAVVHDLAEMLSPYLVLRLFRLLLPVVLVVTLVFLLALPFRGLTGLFDDWSPALILLTMVAAGISLVAITVDQTDAEATRSPFLAAGAQGQALILPLLAGFGAWAVWMRVAQYGWTPDRLFVALIAGLAVVYGLIYAGAVLMRVGWMERIRQGNILMALLVIAVAALWLTPILNAERISAADQLARFESGRTPAEALDVAAIGRWGKPGTEAIRALEALARQPGQEALAARLADPFAAPQTGDLAPLRAELARLMPLQPPTATGTRDGLLEAMVEYTLRDWAASCRRVLPDGRPGCVMVVAELLPLRPGEEAMVVLKQDGDYVQVFGVYIMDNGSLAQLSPLRVDGGFTGPDEALALLRDWQDAPPAVTAPMVNQLGTGESGLIILP